MIVKKFHLIKSNFSIKKSQAKPPVDYSGWEVGVLSYALTLKRLVKSNKQTYLTINAQ